MSDPQLLYLLTGLTATPPAPETEDAPECDHNWELVDLSFDHAFGTQREYFAECGKCGEQKDANKTPHSRCWRVET